MSIAEWIPVEDRIPEQRGDYEEEFLLALVDGRRMIGFYDHDNDIWRDQSPELSRAEGVGLNELLELMRLNPRGTHAN